MDHEAERPSLDTVQQRVIGALLEKERTVPASYPMTLNALRTACNQSSSRWPVVDFDDRTITDALDRLKSTGLARMVHASHGSRTVKYRQVLDERLDLDQSERAVLTVLLLRGPCTPGELRSRTERLHRFAEKEDVEAVLALLRDRPQALAEELPRQAGQHDNRWIHLLGPVDLSGSTTGVAAPASVPAASTVTEVLLVDGPVARNARVVATYDTVARAYADALLDELDAKPLDRWMLERVAELANDGPVADAGCGPGQVAFHLAAAGADVTGFDLSPAMVAEAVLRFPELPFEVGDLTALPPPASDARGWAAVTAWYSLVHLAGSELRPAVALLAAALRPGGWLALAVHVGPEVRHLADWWGHDVDLDFALHDPQQVLDAVATAGLVDVEWYRRGPYAGGEAETERLYVLARRPGPAAADR